MSSMIGTLSSPMQIQAWPGDHDNRSSSVVTRSRSYELEALRAEPNSARDLLIRGCRVGHYLVSRDPGGRAWGTKRGTRSIYPPIYHPNP